MRLQRLELRPPTIDEAFRHLRELKKTCLETGREDVELPRFKAVRYILREDGTVQRTSNGRQQNKNREIYLIQNLSLRV